MSTYYILENNQLINQVSSDTTPDFLLKDGQSYILSTNVEGTGIIGAKYKEDENKLYPPFKITNVSYVSDIIVPLLDLDGNDTGNTQLIEGSLIEEKNNKYYFSSSVTINLNCNNSLQNLTEDNLSYSSGSISEISSNGMGVSFKYDIDPDLVDGTIETPVSIQYTVTNRLSESITNLIILTHSGSLV